MNKLYAVQMTLEEAEKLAPRIVNAAVWFSFEPMPGNNVELSVKAEVAHLVAGWMTDES